MFKRRRCSGLIKMDDVSFKMELGYKFSLEPIAWLNRFIIWNNMIYAYSWCNGT